MLLKLQKLSKRLIDFCKPAKGILPGIDGLHTSHKAFHTTLKNPKDVLWKLNKVTAKALKNRPMNVCNLLSFVSKLLNVQLTRRKQEKRPISRPPTMSSKTRKTNFDLPATKLINGRSFVGDIEFVIFQKRPIKVPVSLNYFWIAEWEDAVVYWSGVTTLIFISFTAPSLNESGGITRNSTAQNNWFLSHSLFTSKIFKNLIYYNTVTPQSVMDTM